VLRKTDYQPYYPNRNITEKMVDETYEAEKAVNRFIYDGKLTWKYEAKWINEDIGSFTVEKHLNNLRHQNVVELHKKLQTREILKDHWVFSSISLYS
jgi:hypothetical protein